MEEGQHIARLSSSQAAYVVITSWQAVELYQICDMRGRIFLS